MRSANLMIATLLGLAACFGTQAQSGLKNASQTSSWPLWQGRSAFGLTTSQSPGLVNQPQLSGLSLLGDYFFYRSSSDYPSKILISGLRATSGVMLGNVSPRLLSGSGAGLIPSGSAVSRHALGSGAATGSFIDVTASAYLGLGFTQISADGGWGFSADIGMSALSGRSGIQLGRNPSAAGGGAGQSLDDILREMRLMPLLQLGVSYSF